MIEHAPSGVDPLWTETIAALQRAPDVVHSPRVERSETSERSSNSPHRADIDGLRAVAVLLVLLYHAGLGFPGGFVGVDVFFVISGFLIAGVILRDREAGTFTLSGFWLRRVRRIAPAAACLTAAVLLAGEALLIPKDLVALAESAMAHQLMVANIYFWQQGGYFDGPAEFKPLLHTWSLSVEEQFYILFPLLFWVGGRLSRRALFGVLAIVGAVSLALSAVLTSRLPLASFYLLPTRAWELLLGSLLAFSPAPDRLPRRLREALAALGLGLILLAGWLYTSSLDFPGVAALLPTLGAAALLHAGRVGPTAIGRLLAIRPLAIVGAASYSVYLWHWPLLAFLHSRFGRTLSTDMRLGVVVASLALGAISWLVIEEPIRRKRLFPSNRELVTLFTSVAAALLFTGLYFVLHDGLPGRLSMRAAMLAEAKLATLRVRQPGSDAPCDVVPIGAIQEGQPPQPVFLLWGDSHARAIASVTGQVAESRGLQGYLAWRGGHAPLIGVTQGPGSVEGPEEHLRWSQEMLNFVARKRIRHVLIAARWDSKLNDGPSLRQHNALIRDIQTVRPSREDARRVFRSALARTLSLFEAAGARVWLLRQVPAQDGELVRSVQDGRFDASRGRLPRGVPRAEYDRQQSGFTESIAGVDLPTLKVIGPGPKWFDADGFSKITNGTRVYYTDADHVSVDGDQFYYRELLEPVFDEIAREGRRTESKAAHD